MIRILKVKDDDGYGEVIVETDAPDIETFGSELAEAIQALVMDYAVNDDEQGVEQVLGSLIPNALRIAAYMSGRSSRQVKRLLVGGCANPNRCTLLVEREIGPV